MRAFPANTDRAVILGASAWALSAVFFVGQGIAQAASTRPFSLATNLISDLGNTACGPDVCSPLHGLVNSTFVVAGSLHMLGAITTYRAWPRPWLNATGAWVIAVAGLGLCMAGIFPENEAVAAHATFALIGLVSLNLAMIMIGSILIGAVRWLGVAAYAAGIGGFIGLGMFLNHAAGVPIGVAERIADYPGAAMVVVLGLFVLGSAVSSRRRALKADSRVA